MTSKLIIRESESRRPAASSILISRMTSSSIIIPYRIHTSELFLCLKSLLKIVETERKYVVMPITDTPTQHIP